MQPTKNQLGLNIDFLTAANFVVITRKLHKPMNIEKFHTGSLALEENENPFY